MSTSNPSPGEGSKQPKSFAALSHPGARPYILGGTLIWMGDSIEHVISYWMIFQKFESQELAGFAIIAHWLPFLLFSVWAGALADKFDPRRLIQIGAGLFILASLGWGVLFLTDSLEMWHAVALLVVHGMAGVVLGPASQLLIHDIVGSKDLQSAVRLIATGRHLGFLAGPAVGGVLLLVFGPAWGILINILVYLPLTLWLWRAPYGPKFQDNPSQRGTPVKGFCDIVETVRAISGNRTIVSMTLLAGAASFMVGSGHTSHLPEFSLALGHADGLFYSILFGANAAGAFCAGIVLEGWRVFPSKPRTAVVLVCLWALAIGGFALSRDYPFAVTLLFIAGFLNLTYNSMAQALVQLSAPAAIRGRVVGLYAMSRNGLMAFSGVTIGMVGGQIGIHTSLAISAGILIVLAMSVLPMTARAEPA
jgi:MFS family permease